MNDTIAAQAIFEDICWYYKWKIPERELRKKTETEYQVKRVCESYGWDELNEAQYKANISYGQNGLPVGEEAKIRNLRKKYVFLMEKVLHRDKEKFQENSDDFIPKCDAPVVATLLMHAVSKKKTEYSPIKNWFNGKIKNTDYSEIVSLYLVIEKCLIILCKDKMIITEEIFNKWKTAIRFALDYEVALNITRISEKVYKAFSSCQIFSDDDIDREHETELSRSFRLRSITQHEKNRDELLKACTSKGDYVDFIESVIRYMYNDIIEKSKNIIEDDIVSAQNNDIKYLAGTADENSIVDLKAIRSQKIIDFLSEHPAVRASLEAELDTERSFEYFELPAEEEDRLTENQKHPLKFKAPKKGSAK